MSGMTEEKLLIFTNIVRERIGTMFNTILSAMATSGWSDLGQVLQSEARTTLHVWTRTRVYSHWHAYSTITKGG